MNVPEEILHALCPMHVALTASGHIRQAGATLHKLGDVPLEGAHFFDVFEVYRPRAVTSMAGLLQVQGRKMSLRTRTAEQMHLKGVSVATGNGGVVVNFGFGLALVDAVRNHALTATDFAPTDLAIEMLWLLEAKAAVLSASRSLNIRLQGAKDVAEERAFTDTLTGLRNRRALDTVLERITRQGHPYALMHLDLDFFKQVNDTMGHGAGDHVLREAAHVMLDVTRKEDTVARVGGDEFVIVFASLIRPARLAELAERLIRQIERPVPYEGRECRISASIGITVSDGTMPPAAVIDQADLALYASKRAGRARFSFYPEDVVDVPEAQGKKK